MKKFSSKLSASKKKATAKNVATVNDLTVAAAKMVHTGKVLTIDDVNRNRSSKYSYLAF